MRVNVLIKEFSGDENCALVWRRGIVLAGISRSCVSMRRSVMSDASGGLCVVGWCGKTNDDVEETKGREHVVVVVVAQVEEIVRPPARSRAGV